MRRILGLDPGLAETGYGMITVARGRCRHLCHGVISTEPAADTGARLERIYSELARLIEAYGPTEASIESLYFARNAKSALPVAQARGVALLACSQRGLRCFEYPPQAIKQALVGTGRAEKAQVQHLVKLVLGLPEIPRPDHAADALAAAICHFNTVDPLVRLAGTHD